MEARKQACLCCKPWRCAAESSHRHTDNARLSQSFPPYGSARWYPAGDLFIDDDARIRPHAHPLLAAHATHPGESGREFPKPYHAKPPRLIGRTVSALLSLMACHEHERLQRAPPHCLSASSRPSACYCGAAVSRAETNPLGAVNRSQHRYHPLEDPATSETASEVLAGSRCAPTTSTPSALFQYNACATSHMWYRHCSAFAACLKNRTDAGAPWNCENPQVHTPKTGALDRLLACPWRPLRRALQLLVRGTAEVDRNRLRGVALVMLKF
jgi:hypothetical protein